MISLLALFFHLLGIFSAVSILLIANLRLIIELIGTTKAKQDHFSPYVILPFVGLFLISLAARLVLK